MKKLTSIVLMCLAVVVLSACNGDDIGAGKNKQLNEEQKQLLRDPATADQLYGKIEHEGHVAPEEIVLVSGQDISKDLSLISILTKGNAARPGTAFLLACDKRGGTLSMASNITTPSGQGTENALDIAIMNLSNGITDIRETDDTKRQYFSTAEGDHDIIAALKNLKTLDPESTITFMVEETRDDGYRYTIGWSPMFKVKQVVEGLKKIDLSKCDGLPMDENYYSYISSKDLMGK